MDHMMFIQGWNASSHQVRAYLRAEVQDGLLFGVEVRFRGQDFPIDTETFEQLCSRIFSVSKGCMQTTSTEDDFRSGILHIAVLFCNHGYTPAIITSTLEFILNEILPEIAIK